jgi:predicted Zn-dependent protease
VSLPDGNPRIPEGINASEENPLKEFALLALGITASVVVLVAMLSLSAQWLAPFVPFSWEQKANPALGFYLAEESKELAAAETAMVKLAQQLLNTSMQIDIDGQNPAQLVPSEAFRFHLKESDMPNAFATLGANVLLTDALLQKVSSENGLAMVIAHEIAHVQLRHPIEAAGRGIVIQLTLAAVLGSSDNNMLGGVLTSGGVLTMLSFNRDMELDADARALEILRSHYGHVGGADEFFLAMNREHGSEEWLEFAQTHPSTERRLEQIRKAMRSDGALLPLRELPAELDRAKLQQ